MKKIKTLQNDLNDSKKIQESHNERIQKLIKINDTITTIENDIKGIMKSNKENDDQIKILVKKEIEFKTDLESRESELETSLEESKLLYNACNESCLIYLNSHKQLERDASEGYTNKLNKCDEDIDQTTLEKKEIEKILLKITPRSVEMEQMINKSTSTLKKINDNIMVKELEAEADTLSNKIKECLTEYEHFNVKDNHRKMIELERDINELKENMARSSGSKMELTRQLKDTLRELKDKKFKDIEKRVREFMIVYQ
jgi:chromosome segregation ATPase